jgi:hypothetical protein
MKVPQQTSDGNSCGFFASENIRLICLNREDHSTKEGIIDYFSNLGITQGDMDKKRKENLDIYKR